MKWICIALLKVYKAIISPLLGKSCIYTPSCSVYAMEAYEEHGFFKGSFLTAKRVFSCNPWSKKGGADFVPYNLRGEIKWSL